MNIIYKKQSMDFSLCNCLQMHYKTGEINTLSYNEMHDLSKVFKKFNVDINIGNEETYYLYIDIFSNGGYAVNIKEDNDDFIVEVSAPLTGIVNEAFHNEIIIFTK